MMTLIFNTTEKAVDIHTKYPDSGPPIETFRDVPTVKVREEGMYEVFQTGDDGRVYPIVRFPVCDTIMFIRK